MAQFIDFPEDAQRICEVALRYTGLYMTLGEAQECWEARSEKACAGWLPISDNRGDARPSSPEFEILEAISDWLPGNLRDTFDARVDKLRRPAPGGSL